MMQQKEAVEEVHLSHNLISGKGLAALLSAIVLHPSAAYPFTTSNGWEVPCWMRVEHNCIDKPDALLAFLTSEEGLRHCLAPRGKKHNCQPTICTEAEDKAWEKIPHVHLFCIMAQEGGMDKDKVIASDKAFCCKLVNQAKQVLLQTGKNHENASAAASQDVFCGNPNAFSGVPVDDEVLCRNVILKVDPECGAGLDLEATDHGFFVAGADENPGQDLRTGDVLLEIAGVPLWGLSEDELESEFGRNFVNGAQIRSAAYDAVRGRAVKQPLGIQRLNERCPVLLDGFRADLDILCGRFGVRAELRADDGAVVLRGNPVPQRWAAHELAQLATYYFPELHSRSDPPPPCMWVVGDAHLEAATNADMGAAFGAWEAAILRQAQELLEEGEGGAGFVEALEAPDEGPEVFEGEAMSRGFQVVWPIRIVLLVGLPGSGKSTLAGRLADENWESINQDTLGSRGACLSAARAALSEDRRVVIDRCNVSYAQRSLWLSLADEFQACV
eukprot:gnl/MRDRNA2_/MRDRNA2_86338_c0_seq3.p1 gnl/MRDRNA2_/MRDRNA2_86338_c0~~gnl/MRDRNA2_/MRDRNA2_86338_c0_seq3.p1  ORF type:complete len:501 (-),score=106.28 gnl/MRDRNA2_/MRDRNA2_86338_c0_seq3:275-1777(-)